MLRSRSGLTCARGGYYIDSTIDWSTARSIVTISVTAPCTLSEEKLKMTIMLGKPHVIIHGVFASAASRDMS